MKYTSERAITVHVPTCTLQLHVEQSLISPNKEGGGTGSRILSSLKPEVADKEWTHAGMHVGVKEGLNMKKSPTSLKRCTGNGYELICGAFYVKRHMNSDK